MDISSIVNMILPMLGKNVSEWVTRQLNAFGTSFTEIFSWQKNPPTPDRQKELIKAVLKHVAEKPLLQTLQYLEGEHDENAAILIKRGYTKSGKVLPVVNIISYNSQTGEMIQHQQFPFVSVGDIIIDTIQREKQRKEQEQSSSDMLELPDPDNIKQNES